MQALAGSCYKVHHEHKLHNAMPETLQPSLLHICHASYCCMNALIPFTPTNNISWIVSQYAPCWYKQLSRWKEKWMDG